MNQTDLRFFEAAFAVCMGNIEKGTDRSEAIEDTIKTMGALVSDEEELREYLYKEVSFSSSDAASMLCADERRGKDKEWWNKFKEENGGSGKYWNRYKAYLSGTKKWSQKTIEKSINEPTDFVMNCLANPNSGVPESSYGEVFGYVQSGKTANYIGLINKAVDAGYKIIIVLAGMHNNLRSQTQMRIDEEVLGFETSIDYLKKKKDQGPAIGVGTMGFQMDKSLEPLTSRDEKGDFTKSRANVSRVYDQPKIFIVKKNTKVLQYVFDNLSKNHAVVENPDGTKTFSCKYSLLLIDDEADQASLNNKYKTDKSGNISDESDVSKTNELIRRILGLFSCCSYVGYTATPYANVFIPPNIDDSELGNDLFPKDFIVCLPKPNGYVGAMEFFGEDEESEIMPLRRKITTDLEDFIDVRTKQIIAPIPDELKTAILHFIIITAARNVRGQTLEPNSMLIHINRFVDVQGVLKSAVSNYYDEVKSYINGGDAEIFDIMHDIWEKDFIPTTKTMQRDFSSYMEGVECSDWCDIEKEIKRLIGNHQIKVMEINGRSDDVLCYKEYKDEKRQLNVIAIGGDKLSRGLTLEGLTVSFFMRSSMMYDTLMQMGRWFGFRPKYTDLCRLFVPDELFRWFMVVSFATENLRNQIQYMNEYNRTPMDFGLRIASHPEMLISSRAKIKTGRECTLTFSNSVSQTRSIDISTNTYDSNFEAAERFINKLGKESSDHWTKLGRTSNTDHIFWDDVDGNLVADFFADYKTSKNANKVNSLYMADYVRDQIKNGGLVKWTVCLKNIGNMNPPLEIGNYKIGQGLKRSEGQYAVDASVCSIKALKSKDEEYVDFTAEQMKEKDAMKANDAKDESIRKELRTRDRGLLILCPLDPMGIKGLQIAEQEYKTPFGFIAVFPDNEGKGESRRYRINPIGIENGD
ncbi:MAG: Z1 domain-containing protein [Oscillospiraceae bacterium]|nr:Z1 domain-containing protein [Oscillospiraceae bacterium]